MANGNSRDQIIRAVGRAAKRGRRPSSARSGQGKAKLKRMLGMRKSPTTAGRALFGDVDVTGAQTTAREQERLNAVGLAGELADLTGAQTTEQERRRLRLGGR
jgi:hypothetical protein